MKKIVIWMLLLMLSLPLFALAEDGVAFSWRDYAMRVTLATTDPSAVRVYNGPTGGTMAMVTLTPVSGLVKMTDIKAYAEDFTLRAANGTEFKCYGWQANDFKKEKSDPSSIFPEIADEQDDFGLLFFLKGMDADGLNGASLAVKAGDAGPLLISLDLAPHALPEKTSDGE